MPRRSGTTTVWSSTKTAATGAHMSPVSPKPCSMTTAGPLPPTRTWIVAPSALMFRFRKLGGNEPTFADDGTVSPPFERRRVTPRQVSVRTGRRHLRRWCQDGAGAAPAALLPMPPIARGASWAPSTAPAGLCDCTKAPWVAGSDDGSSHLELAEGLAYSKCQRQTLEAIRKRVTAR